MMIVCDGGSVRWWKCVMDVNSLVVCDGGCICGV